MTRLPPLWIQAGDYAASVDRRLVGALWPRGACTGFRLTSFGDALYVVASRGQAVVVVGDYLGDNPGAVLCAADATEAVNFGPAPPGGTDRVDIVAVAPLADDINSDPANEWRFQVFPGTPAPDPVPSPNPPEILNGQGVLALATVRIRGGAATIDQADITHLNPPPLAPLTSYAVPGGILYTGTVPDVSLDIMGSGLVFGTGAFNAPPRRPLTNGNYVRVQVSAEFASIGLALNYQNYLRCDVYNQVGQVVMSRQFWHNQPTNEPITANAVGTGSWTVRTAATTLRVDVYQVAGAGPGTGFRYEPHSVWVAASDEGAMRPGEPAPPTSGQLPAVPGPEPPIELPPEENGGEETEP